MSRLHVRTSRLFPLVLLLALVGVAGCASSKKADAPEAGVTQRPELYGRQVYVLVDGKQRGSVPGTVRVRRGMGARMVSLWQAGAEIRTYELQTVATADGSQLSNSFFGEEDATSTVYDVAHLPTARGENNFIVPYSRHRITVEDRTYGLTIIVDE